MTLRMRYDVAIVTCGKIGMENIKYVLFYVLLIAVIVAGSINYHWLVIFLAALILTISYIMVKGREWRQLMGRTDLNGVVVFIGTFISQMVLSSILYGIGRLIGYLLL